MLLLLRLSSYGDWRAGSEVVRAAVVQNVWALKYAAPEFKFDAEMQQTVDASLLGLGARRVRDQLLAAAKSDALCYAFHVQG